MKTRSSEGSMETNDDVTMVTSLRKEKKAFYFSLSSKLNTGHKMFTRAWFEWRQMQILLYAMKSETR